MSSSTRLQVTRILQSPLGHPAPEGERGDIVRITDGTLTIYLDPSEYDRTDAAHLPYLLARHGTTPRPRTPGAHHRSAAAVEPGHATDPPGPAPS